MSWASCRFKSQNGSKEHFVPPCFLGVWAVAAAPLPMLWIRFFIYWLHKTWHFLNWEHNTSAGNQRVFHEPDVRSSPEIKRGRKSIGSPKLAHNWPQDKSLRFSLYIYFLTSEGLDIQRCWAGTSAHALETPVPPPEPRAGGISVPGTSLKLYLFYSWFFFFFLE